MPPAVPQEEGVAERRRLRLDPSRAGPPAQADRDLLVVEEPLEIRVAGETLAVTMRTPGQDRELALGFLRAEGVIAGIEEVGSVAHCGRPGDDSYGNVLEVLPAPGVVFEEIALAGSRRGTLTTSACGICGRRNVDDLLARIGPVGHAPPMPARLVASLPDVLRATQRNFALTGGIHAAAACDGKGRLLAVAEDVGRHNAVDKVAGQLMLARAGPAAALVVSGRVSFEIVQKAAAMAVPVLAAVSAPTALAVDLADAMGIGLAAFVRGGAFNVYSHEERFGHG